MKRYRSETLLRACSQVIVGKMSVSGDFRQIYFRDLDGAHHLWYASSEQCYLSPLRPNDGQIYPNTTSAIQHSLVPADRSVGGMPRVGADQLILLAAIHGVQLRCLMGSFNQCLEYAKDICERYFANRVAKLWPRLKSMVDRYYSRFEDYTAQKLWMRRNRYTRTFAVTIEQLDSQKVMSYFFTLNLLKK